MDHPGARWRWRGDIEGEGQAFRHRIPALELGTEILQGTEEEVMAILFIATRITITVVTCQHLLIKIPLAAAI
jgi:hypothetical protein